MPAEVPRFWLLASLLWGALYLYVATFNARLMAGGPAFQGEHFGLPASVVNLLSLGLLLLTVLAFLCIVARLTHNSRLTAGPHWYGSRWVLAGYAVPPFCLFVPFAHLMRLAERHAPQLLRHVYLWWASFNLFVVILILGVISAVYGGPGGAAGLWPVLGVLGAVAFFVSCVAFGCLALQLGRQQCCGGAS